MGPAVLKKQLLLLVWFATSHVANAQELQLLSGITQHSAVSETTYAWSIEYAQGLGEHAYVTFGWLNEGHLREHHRDGPAAQIWGRVNLLDRRLSLVFGIGPYAYFDTAQAEQGASYTNDHGFGMIYSAGLTWYTEQRWFVHLRANQIEVDTHVDTNMLLFGVGYQLDPPGAVGPQPWAAPLAPRQIKNELSIFVGRTILNSFQSEDSTATEIEYRRALGQYVDWTVGWLHEGAHEIIRRNGVTTQLWLVRSFFDDRFTLGGGAGVYFVLNKEHPIENGAVDDERESIILSTLASYRLDRHWSARITWNRIMTGYNRDTDILLFGGGYRF